MNEYHREAVWAFVRSLRDALLVVGVMGFMLALAIFGFWLYTCGSGWWIACAVGFVVTFILVLTITHMDAYL